jgi:hypothetical protein
MIDGTFRLNPAVEVVVFDRLDDDVRARFEALTRDPTFYGLLRTPTTAKAVDRDSALLLLTLRAPGAIPHYALRALGTGARRRLAGWVLDGILEVEQGGAWVSGPAAVSVVDPDGANDRGRGEGGVIGRLSAAALRYAAALPMRDPVTLAHRLYRYNHVPLSPRYRRAYATETVEQRLGLSTPGAARMLSLGWTRIPSVGRPWVSWVARRDVDQSSVSHGTYKLYVSPAVDALRAVVADVVSAVARGRPLAWKAGAGPYGLLRPDKMVIYFARQDDLHVAAAAATRVLGGVCGQGVPFTSPVDADGVLSWGIDPPDDEGLHSLLGSESWRERLTNRIGAAFIQAPQGESVDVRVRFVHLRLQAHGIDTTTWAPA